MGEKLFRLVTKGSQNSQSGSSSPSPSPTPTDESGVKACQNDGTHDNSTDASLDVDYICLHSCHVVSGGSKTTDKTLTENLYKHRGTAKGATGADIPFEPLLLRVYRSELPRARWAQCTDDEIFGDRELAQDNSIALFADRSDLDYLAPRRHDRGLVMAMPNHPIAIFQREVNALAAFIVNLEHVGIHQPEWPRVQADGSVEYEVIDNVLTSIQCIYMNPHVPYGAANNPFATVELHMQYATGRWLQYEEHFVRIQGIYVSLPHELLGDPVHGVLSYALLFAKLQAIFSCWVRETDIQIRAEGEVWLQILGQ